MSGSPIDDALHALIERWCDADALPPLPEAAYAQARVCARELKAAITAVQQQQPDDDLAVVYALGRHDERRSAQQAEQSVAFEGTDAEVLREFTRACREARRVGQWPGERVCAAIERVMANERPFRFITEAAMVVERDHNGRGGDGDRTLSGPRRAYPPPSGQGCACPSGDGSLRWPCPAHPPVKQGQAVAGLHFGVIEKVAHALSRLGRCTPEGKEEQAARAVEMIEELCVAALCTAPPPSVPDGWVLVPREPTELMARVFRADEGAPTFFTHTTVQCADFASRYAAMLTVAGVRDED